MKQRFLNKLIENEESMDLLSRLIVDEERKGNKIKRKIMAIDGSNVMRIRGSRATFFSFTDCN